MMKPGTMNKVLKQWHRAFTQTLSDLLVRAQFSSRTIEENYIITEPQRPWNQAAAVMHVVEQILATEDFVKTSGPYTMATVPDNNVRAAIEQITCDDLSGETREQLRRELLAAIEKGGIYVNVYHAKVCPHLPSASEMEHIRYLIDEEKNRV